MNFLLILLYCAFLKSSFSLHVEDFGLINNKRMKLKTQDVERQTNVPYLESDHNLGNTYNEESDDFIEESVVKMNSLRKVHKQSKVSLIKTELSRKENTKSLQKLPSGEKKEYFFLSDLSGAVWIFDPETYDVITSYDLPDIAWGIGAIVNDTFYNIDTTSGQIKSTNIESLVTSGNDVQWANVGSFPKEIVWCRNQGAVNDSYIYFLTESGVLYAYNVTSKWTIKIGNVEHESRNARAALIVVDQVLYFYKSRNFYSFDGKSIREIETPDSKFDCGLFQLGSQICLLGGNETEIYPDPINCFDPQSQKWNTPLTLDEFRRAPGVVSNQFGTYIFGGYAHYFNNTHLSDFWRETCLALDPNFNFWGYILCPFTEGPEYPQAISFFY